MSLRGVEIKEGRVGPNVAGDNREFGLIGNAVAIADKFELNKAYELRRPADAVAIGIDADYDATHSVNFYRHITEFYRRAGEGKVLLIMGVAQTVMPKDMVTQAKVLAAESGLISDMGVVFNPINAYTGTLVDGMNQDVFEGIAALQAFAEWCDEKDMPLHTLLECRGMGDTISGLPNLRALENDLHATKVTLIAGQDWNYAEKLAWENGKKFADVGTYLGVVASQAWNRNPGEVATQNLTAAAQGIFTVGGLSNHKKYSEVFEQLETLDEKGYVFPIRYQGLAGYFWNDGHCCAPIIVDAEGNMNQHMIYYSHAIDESKRALRVAFLPEVKKPVVLEDGKLPQDMVDYYDAVGDGAFSSMANVSLISDGKTYTDPDSDLLVAKVLNVGFKVVPTGMTNLIKGTINLKTA
ncbi:DUF2586 family protein [Bacteroidales bacterium OttesenSCG-928-C19]|nr:DUF2586 family protein [Bacteroidales bacterium OttesenSCG-928-C19]